MRTMASFQRFGHVLRVATRHALVHMVSRCLARWPNIANKICGPPLSGPHSFKKLLEEMGGTFVKLGQMLALQSDLLPLEYCRVLFTLFDTLAPFSYEEVERTFQEDLQRTRKRYLIHSMFVRLQQVRSPRCMWPCSAVTR